MSKTETNSVRSNDLVSLEEERAVIDRLQAGDRAAFTTLYQWYGDRIWRQAILPRQPNPTLAEDCLRDTFRTVLEKIGQFTLRDRSIFFWIHRIAVNKTMDSHRRTKRDRDLNEAVRTRGERQQNHAPAPDQGLEQADLQRMIGLSLDLLNPRYATALRLRLLEDLDREECARIMEVTVGNFDVILHRATKAFRKVYPP